MSLSQQFGYTSYVNSGSPLTSSQLLPPPPLSSSSSSSPTMSSPCCENGRSLVNPHTGQTMCSCQYPAGLLTYSRVGLPDPVYPTTPYSAPQGYMPLGTDPSAFYPSLNSPYELKEAGETWRSIGQPPGCYPYDPTSMSPYPYPNAYGGMDINSAARRKNATRENTNTLKAWLYEHRKNPYPTKGEKIMLAIITKMTLTQVSTWFANARRRLKKENKMTWSPRNRSEDGSDDVDNNDDDDDCGDNRRRDIMSPTQELDMTSSKPSSPLLSPDSVHTLENNNRPYKERIIRVDDDDISEDDDDDDDASRDSFHSRRLVADVTERERHLSSRDRSPLRASSSVEPRDDIGEGRSKHSEKLSGRRSQSDIGDSRESGESVSKNPPSANPNDGRASSPTRNPVSATPPVTRPKIWSISDFINTTSSSSSSTSTNSTSSSTSNSHHTSTVASPSALSRSSYITSSAIPSSSPQRPHPNQGFLFLPPGAAAHWPAAAAAARFAGLGGHFPLSLTHSTLSYPYNLATPNAARAGLEAHVHAAQMAARAAAEGGASRDGSSSGEKMALHPHFPRLPVSGLFSPARDIDGVRPQVMPPPRMVVDSSL